MGAVGQAEDMRAKWQEWIRERQWGELLELRRQREMFHELRDAMISDPHAQAFLWMFARMYARDQVITVRSLTDASQDSMSLNRLLHEVLNHPGLLNGQWYVERWVAANLDWEDGEAVANEEYTRLLGEGEIADEWIIFRDIKRLGEETQHVREYANRAVAHISKKKLPRVTFEDLERAVDDVIDMFGRWSTIVAGGWHYIDGRIGGDWKHPFRTALFPGPFDDLPPELRPGTEPR
jgi:hypothetical protein